MVAVGDGERHAALDQRGEELADGLARQLARLLQLRGTALGRRTALGEAAPRTDARGLRTGGLLLVAPAPLAERGGEGRVVSGDLVAAEYDDVGAGRVERGLDQTDRVLGHFRPVLNVGELQYAEFAGMMELQATQPRGHGYGAPVAFDGRPVRARIRRFGRVAAACGAIIPIEFGQTEYLTAIPWGTR